MAVLALALGVLVCLAATPNSSVYAIEVGRKEGRHGCDAEPHRPVYVGCLFWQARPKKLFPVSSSTLPVCVTRIHLASDGSRSDGGSEATAAAVPAVVDCDVIENGVPVRE